jgi:hypothetical protein
MLPLPKVLPAVPTCVAFTVHLRHVFSQLRFLLEMNWFRTSTLITGEPPFMSPLDMLPLLVSVGESLQATVALGIRALEQLSFLVSRMHRHLMPRQMLPTFVVRATDLTAEGSLFSRNSDSD